MNLIWIYKIEGSKFQQHGMDYGSNIIKNRYRKLNIKLSDLKNIWEIRLKNKIKFGPSSINKASNLMKYSPAKR